MEKEPCTKFCGDLVRFHKVIKIPKFEFSVNDVIPPNIQKQHPWFSLHFLTTFMEKKPSLKFYGAFDHFSQTYEIAKF